MDSNCGLVTKMAISALCSSNNKELNDKINELFTELNKAVIKGDTESRDNIMDQIDSLIEEDISNPVEIDKSLTDNMLSLLRKLEVNPKDVELVMAQTMCSEEKAIDAVLRYKGDILGAVLYASDCN